MFEMTSSNYFLNNFVGILTLLWCLNHNFNRSLSIFLIPVAPSTMNSYMKIEKFNLFLHFHLILSNHLSIIHTFSNLFINSCIFFSWNWPDTGHSPIISAFQLRGIRLWQASLRIVPCRKAAPVGVDANNTHLHTKIPTHWLPFCIQCNLVAFWLKFHSNLFARFQLTITKHWFW